MVGVQFAVGDGMRVIMAAIKNRPLKADIL